MKLFAVEVKNLELDHSRTIEIYADNPMQAKSFAENAISAQLHEANKPNVFAVVKAYQVIKSTGVLTK